MKYKSMKLLLWAIFLILLSICIRVLFTGYVIPGFFLWLSFALPVVSILLAAYTLFRDCIGLDDQE